MDMRLGYFIIFTMLSLALAACTIDSFKSSKSIGRALGLLELALIPPVIGNAIIVVSGERIVSLIGYYIYFIGTAIVMATLVNFANNYCGGNRNSKRKPTVMYIILFADIVQMLLNPIFGHAFDVKSIDVDGETYYKLVPHFGQTIHRIAVYFVFLCVILIFMVMAAQTARVYRERYTVVLIGMIVTGLWQIFYIFSGKPVDRSMIGFGLFGILVFYLAIYYRPLRLLDRMLSRIASRIPDSLFVYDPDGKPIWANDPARELTGVKENELELIIERLTEMFGKRDPSRNDWSEDRVIGNGDDALYYSLEMHSVMDEKNQFMGSFLYVRDKTEEKNKLKKELYNLNHDSMTGLYARHYMFENIRNMLDSNPDTEYFTVFLDVKNFKIVNDIFGSDFGDFALCQIANWIKDNVSEKCVYGRIAGDTFGVMVPSDEFDADKLEEDLANFVVTDGIVSHQLHIYLGVYAVRDREADVSVMFDRAHFAISSATDEYNTHIAFYDDKLREKVMWDQKISSNLHEAIETMQIRPYLQPITDNNGKVVGAEALARWIHPEYGFMPPYKFIPLFENNGMIVDVDRHMWRCACELLSEWKGKHDDLFISVNISPMDFYYINVVSEISKLVKEYDIEPRKLRLEITETVMMNDAGDRMKTLDEFRKLGFIVEMDDFGSGYSSLNLLKDMPVDVLKIDMKFLSDSEENEKPMTILKNIVKLSEELKIVSLTEGVETEQQYMQLSEMGCKLFHGYYFSKPLPENEFEEYLKKSA